MVESPDSARKRYQRKLFWQQVLSYVTSGIARFCVIIYIILAHMLRLVMWSDGLVIEYINHKPWPYKELFKSFFEPWDDFN